MREHTFFTGQPIFTQLIKFIPRTLISDVVRTNCSDRYFKRFKTFDHLVSMLYVGFHQCNSIREAITGLQANHRRLLHTGLKHTPRRSTFSDANQRRSAEVFEQIYHKLFAHYYKSLPDSRSSRSIKERLYIIDSTTITLFSDIIKGAGSYKANGQKKGGVKAHMLLHAKHDVASFVRITAGSEHDLVFLQELEIPKGSVVVFDKAYTNYKKFREWDQKSVRWVTRLKSDAVVEPLQINTLSEKSVQRGITEDKLVTLGRPSNRRQTPLIKARHIVYTDPVSNKRFDFITNDCKCKPERIADTYKQRWQIELVFKRIKQRYPLRYFLGDNENAIRIQIWTALICDLLTQIVKDHAERKSTVRWSYANIASMIKHHLMTYIKLIPFLRQPEKALLHYNPPWSERLTLF